MNAPSARIALLALLLALPALGAAVWHHPGVLLAPLLHGRSLLAGLYGWLAFLPLADHVVNRLAGPNAFPGAKLERLVFVGFLAVFLWSAAGFVLLTLHLGYAAVFPLLTAASLLFFRPWWRQMGGRGQHMMNTVQLPVLSVWLILFIGALLVIISAALLPPLGYDAHEYHLAVPQTYLQSHTWQRFDYNVYAAFPMTVEMLYLWPLAMDSAAGGTVINGLLAVLGAGAAAALGRYWQLGEWSHRAALVFLSTGMGVALTLQANIDLGLSASAALLLLAYERHRRHHSKVDIVFMALALGFALGAKYIALLSVLLPFIIMAGGDAWVQRRSRPLKTALWVGMGGMLLFLPWLLRNTILYLNPVYPLLFDWFGGRPQFFHELFQAAHSPPQTAWGQTLFTFLLLPFEKSLITSSLPLGFSPLWLLGVPALFAAGRRHPAARAAVFALTAYAAWFFFTQRNDRFLASVLPILSLLPLLAMAFAPPGWLKQTLKWVLIAGITLQLWAAMIAVIYNDTVGQLTHPALAPTYMAQRLPHYRAIDKLNTLKREGRVVGTVLFIGEAQSYGAEFKAIAPTVFNHHPLQQGLPPDVTHILYNQFELNRLRRGYGPLGWRLGGELAQWIENARQNRLSEIYDAFPEIPGRVLVYKINR